MTGELQAAYTSDPIPLGTVQLHGGDIVRADSRGHFTLTAPKGLHRIVLTASDTFGNYVKTTKVIYPAVVSGVTYTLITMLRKAPSDSYMATDEMILTMGSEEERNIFAEIHIPPQSVFSEDGSVYTGEVLVSLTAIDSRNMTDIINAPSELTFVNEEGEVQPLKTFGMFNLQLADPAGKPLQAQGDIGLMLDLDLLGHNIQDLAIGDNLPKVWVLDSATGQWVKIADMKTDQGSVRLKREASTPRPDVGNATLVVGNVKVPFSGKWINYDTISEGPDLCLSRIRLYETNEFDLQIENTKCPKPGLCANPYVIVRDGEIFQGYNHNFGSEFGYCVSHPCDVSSEFGYHGYVFVEHEGQRTFAVNESNAGTGIRDEALRKRINYKSVGDAISVNFSYIKQNIKKSSKSGPFYLMDASGTYDSCKYTDDKDNHFRFYVLEKADCKQTVNTKYADGNDNIIAVDVSNSVSNPCCYAFYTKDLYPKNNDDKRHKAMYIKIKTNSSRNVLFQAQSKIGNSIDDCSTKIGEIYGDRTGCAKAGEPICLEVKPSGPVFAYEGDIVGLTDERYDATHLVVQTVKDQGRGMCSGFRLNKDLVESINAPIDFVSSYKFEIDFTKHFMETEISHEKGVYFYAGDKEDTLTKVRDHALASCKAGCNPATCTSPKGTDETNHALEFFCN